MAQLTISENAMQTLKGMELNADDTNLCEVKDNGNYIAVYVKVNRWYEVESIEVEMFDAEDNEAEMTDAQYNELRNAIDNELNSASREAQSEAEYRRGLWN